MAKKSKSRTSKEAAKKVKRAYRKNPKRFILCVAVLLVLVLAAGAIYYFRFREEPAGESGDELTIHFLDVGNSRTGDSILLKTGNTEVLIDAGSRKNSADTLVSYIQTYCTDGTLEYVIATHADQDHIAAFVGPTGGKSIFRSFDCKTIIDFPRTGKSTQLLSEYREARDAEVAAGAKHYTALECWKEENGAHRSYSLGEGITMEILYNYYYEHDTGDENNYSVCLLFTQGSEHFLFTGDLEKSGEEYLVEYNKLPRCKLYKAGHHGSPTSSSEALLSVIRPEYVCVCCCAGSTEYTDTPENTFPSQAMIDRVGKYTKYIYVTALSDPSAPDGYLPFNGNIVIRSGEEFTVTGSNHSQILKETDWFKQNRVWPADGVN